MAQNVFIALSFNDQEVFKELQQVLAHQLIALLTKYDLTIRLQKQLHMTIYFFGPRQEMEIPALIEQCQHSITTHMHQYGPYSLYDYRSPIKLEFVGQHGVIAIITQPSPVLSHIYTLFTQQFGQNENANAFLPHITLARLQNTFSKDLRKFQQESMPILTSTIKNYSDNFLLGKHELILFSSNQGFHIELARFTF